MSVRNRWRIKLQKFIKWISRLARDYLVRSNPQKEPRVEHMIGRGRVVPGWIFRDYLAGKANRRRTRESLCLANPRNPQEWRNFIELHFSCWKIKKWRNFYTLGFCVLILKNKIHEWDYYYKEDFIHTIKYNGIQRVKLWYEKIMESSP